MRAEAARRLAGRPGFLGVHPLDLEAAEVDPALAADLVVSLRFLHHLPDPATRARVLATLGRLARRDVVLSFHHPVSVHAAWRRLSGWLRRRPSDRHTLSPARLAREAAAAGLRLVSLHPLGRWRRELWLARLVPAPRPGPGGGRTR
jgi:hypothetical protein